MASFGVGGHDVVVEAAVFRGLVDLMLDDPGLDPDAVRLLTEERDAGALTLDLVDSPVREQLEAALARACDRAAAGEVSSRSGEGVATADRLIEGGKAVRALFEA
ncbi:MAG TPA: hypothetical protein VJ456_07120 [Acidimicrobiia bacterium]|nr:hypothetical protein [Acidimicrobiia bacterium]HTC81046.1 hypothetical protein [Acidimicrobiia bacterium]